MSEVTEVLGVGVKRWTIGVTDRGEQRWVLLTFDYTEAAELPPIGATLDPRDAREIASALTHYAALAESRNVGDMN